MLILVSNDVEDKFLFDLKKFFLYLQQKTTYTKKNCFFP